MSKTVVINLGKGSLSRGFPAITARLWSDRELSAEQCVGALPPVPELIDLYRIWQSTYRALSNRVVLRLPLAEDELEIDAGGITQVSQQSFEALSRQLRQAMNRWLSSAGLLPVERHLRSQLNPTDSIRVILETDSDLLLRLPWHCWDFFQDYPYAEMALSQPQYKRQALINQQVRRDRVRILAIVGDARGIDIEPERQLLQALPDAEVTFLVAPSRQAFDRMLWDKIGWDILFFAGHSQSEGQSEELTGRLYINEAATHNSLTVEQLEESLKGAIARGLQLAIFNSCDGVGLAKAIGQLQIPQVIVMREPVPNRVAQTFLQYFLHAFATEKLSLYQAVRQARGQLQGLENEFPGASWLPVLCQNPAVEPLGWFQLGGKPACPYRGLAAFQPADAHLLFGREQSTADLLAAVNTRPFVAVVGASGSGKSSVVFAGLLPQLQLQQQGWQVTSCRPGDRPLDRLAEALLEGSLEKESQAFRMAVLELSVSFQQNRSGLRDALSQQKKRQLLIVDQFEEIYTLCSLEERTLFVDLLLEAAQSAPGFTLLLTLRADFYGEALSDRRMSDALQAGGYNLGPMTRAELARAIAQPAAKMRVMLEAGLTEQLIQATWNRAGHLPLLAFTLSELWRQQTSGQLTHQAYQAMGGVEKALANHAEASYSELSPNEQQRTQRIFMQLIAPGEGSPPTRRLASRDDVGEQNWALVAKLASARLVVTSYNWVIATETVEIIHEALIYTWGRLGYWLQIDGEFRLWQEELRRYRRQWERNDREAAALLKGKQLIRARDWYETRLDELNSKDKTFIEKSLTAQKAEDNQQKRRRLLTVGALSLGMLVTSSLTLMAWWGAQRAQLSEVRAITSASEALFLSNQRLESLVATLQAKRGLDALAWSDKETQNNVTTALRQALSKVGEKNRLSAHKAGTTAVAFSPSAAFIASASQDGTVKLWQPDGTLLNSLEGHRSEIWGLAISPNGQIIASASDDSTVRLWQPGGTLIKTLTGHRGAVNAVAFSPDGRLIASAGEDGEVKLWQSDGTIVKAFSAHGEKIDAIAFSPMSSLTGSSTGQRIATASGDQTIKLWNVDGTLQTTLEGHTGTVRGVAFSPDGKTLASASADDTIKLWNLSNYSQTTLSGHTNDVYGIAFSPDGTVLASAGNDNIVNVWQRDGTLLSTFRGHSNGVTGVAFSPDAQTIASTSFDSSVRLWQRNTHILNELKGHANSVWDVAFSPDSQLLASSSADHSIKLWQSNDIFFQSQSVAKPIKTLNSHTDTVYGISFSPDKQFLASASKDKTVKLWTLEGTLLETLSGHRGWVTAVDISADGAMIASSSEDKTIKLWQRDGALLATLAGHTEGVNAVAFSPDGQMLASASDDKTIRLWQRDGSSTKALVGHTAAVNQLSFSPDGQAIVSASDDRTVRLWNREGELLKTLVGHQDAVIDVAFAHNGEQIASSSADKTVRLWDRNGLLLDLLAGYESGVIGIAFSPDDGSRLATATVDRTVTIWDLASALEAQSLVDLSCEYVEDYLKTNRDLEIGVRSLCN